MENQAGDPIGERQRECERHRGTLGHTQKVDTIGSEVVEQKPQIVSIPRRIFRTAGLPESPPVPANYLVLGCEIGHLLIPHTKVE